MLKITRKQLRSILFFAPLWAGLAFAAVPQGSPLTLGSVQSAAIIQPITALLSIKDHAHLAQANRHLYSIFQPNLRRRFHLEHNTWKYELEKRPEFCCIDRCFEVFVKIAKDYIEKNLKGKENYGLQINLDDCCLGQEKVNAVLSALATIIKECKCEIVELGLHRNGLRKIPQEVYKMVFLKALFLGVNPMQYEPGMFKGIPPIRSLNVQYTLTQITEGLFEGLEHVAILDLYDNNLPTVSLKMLRPLASLKELRLRQTGIRHLEFDEEMSKWMPVLETIDVTNENTAELETQLKAIQNCPFVIEYDKKEEAVLLKRKSQTFQTQKLKDHQCCLL